MITFLGVMWTRAPKDGVLPPALLLVDMFGSSEALGMSHSVPPQTSRYERKGLTSVVRQFRANVHSVIENSTPKS
jgi:hypothetical protein